MHKKDKAVEKELTDREWTVLGLLVKGKSWQEIATELGIAHNTVKRHMTEIKNKTGCRKAIQLGVWYIINVRWEVAYHNGE